MCVRASGSFGSYLDRSIVGRTVPGQTYFAESCSRREDQSLLFDADGILRGIGVRLETGE